MQCAGFVSCAVAVAVMVARCYGLENGLETTMGFPAQAPSYQRIDAKIYNVEHLLLGPVFVTAHCSIRIGARHLLSCSGLQPRFGSELGTCCLAVDCNREWAKRGHRMTRIRQCTNTKLSNPRCLAPLLMYLFQEECACLVRKAYSDL